MRRATALALAAPLLAGTSLLALPDTAHAETKRVSCGDDVTAEPGDKIVGTLDEGVTDLLEFDLGTVDDSTTSLTGTASDIVTGALGGLADLTCDVTVEVADAAKDVPEVGESASKTAEDSAKKLDKSAHDTADTVKKLTSPEKSESGKEQPPSGDQQPPDEQDPPKKDSNSTGTEHTTDKKSHKIAALGSPASGRGVPLQPASLPSHFDSDAAPMRDYGGIPDALPGDFTPAPGVRYGKSVEDYAPRFDLLAAPDDTDGDASEPNASGGAADTGSSVTKAGKAETMPAGTGQPSNPASVPVLLAVITLAISMAGLVRTWVLRRV